MKAVLISIQPKYVKLITDGKKTIEVRKTYPKLETPFKCYIYQSKTLERSPVVGYGFKQWAGLDKIVGEFVCNKIDRLEEHYEEGGFYYSLAPDFNESICLDNWELSDYAKGKPIYGWHISDLKIYNKPKELSEFYALCNHKQHNCIACECARYEPYIFKSGNKGRIFTGCKIMDGLTRPPQSWCYVEV